MALHEPLERYNVSPTLNLNLSIFSFGTTLGCTGTLISPVGHVLTARHCIESEIEGGNAVLRDLQLERMNPDLVKFPEWAIPESILALLEKFTFDKERLGDKTKEVLYTREYDREKIFKALTFQISLDGQLLDAHVIATGPGMLIPRFSGKLTNPSLIQRHHELSNEGYSEGGDFAIIQVNALKGKGCYRLSQNPVKKQDRVHVTAFGCRRVENRDWPEKWKTTVNLVAPDQGVEFPDSSDPNGFVPRGQFITEQEASSCNSGSAVLDDLGEIVGVLVSVNPTTRVLNRRQVSNTAAFSTKRMLELMDSSTKSRLLELNSQCEL